MYSSTPQFLESCQVRPGIIRAPICGSLPSVGVEIGDGGVPVTDINLGGLTIGASTTLKAFSQAIVEHNPEWAHGDQLTVFVAHQLQDSLTNVPRVSIEGVEITLDLYVMVIT